MRPLRQHIARLKETVREVEPHEALDLVEHGARLIDVRETDEIAGGQPPHATHVPRGFLEPRIGELAPDPDQTLLLLCGSGTRSLFAAESLQRLGYRDARSVAGGFARWRDEGLAYDVPRGLDDAARERYARQMILPEVGERGQRRLLDARVLIVGAGGLGSPAALYLAAAGVGTLGVVDDDRVERSNLHRQILHTDARVGSPKTASARAGLEALNPAVRVELHAVRLDAANAVSICEGYDLVIDGSDNFATRYIVNDACVALAIPDVYASIHRFEGQVAVFWPGRGPCYRCLYPEAPPAGLAPPCSEAGVLGVLPGLAGLVLATEALKILLGIGTPLVGRLLRFDALGCQFRQFTIPADSRCACQAATADQAAAG
jgi:molybdopterin/thiamine biosynthesis adenylyltransferase/rhodanese-related sulfurtransferase